MSDVLSQLDDAEAEPAEREVGAETYFQHKAQLSREASAQIAAARARAEAALEKAREGMEKLHGK